MPKIKVAYSGHFHLVRVVDITDEQLEDMKQNGRECNLAEKLWSLYGKPESDDKIFIEETTSMHVSHNKTPLFSLES